MTTRDRRDLIRQFKRRSVPRGVYAVRSRSSQRTWVGMGNDLNAIENSLWFRLEHGLNVDVGLRAEWQTSGPDDLEFLVLETLPADVPAPLVPDELKRLRMKWSSELGARILLP